MTSPTAGHAESNALGIKKIQSDPPPSAARIAALPRDAVHSLFR